MKNIYIIGTPRTGKTTLAKMIKDKFPNYSIIGMEAIRNAFIKTEPHLMMNQRDSEARKNIFPVFVKEFSDWNKNISNYPCIIEGSMIDIREPSIVFDNNDIVMCLAHGCNNMDEIISNIEENDNEDSWTNNWTGEKIKKHLGDLCEIDNQNKIICEEKGYLYFSTSQDRKGILIDILNKLQQVNK